jgi:predicted nuclease with RNAse H fold
MDAITVAGFDVGGTRKGCHVAILQGSRLVLSENSHNPVYLARLCNEFRVVAVGIDSPCRWGKPDFGRLAEKALAKERIFCFATPTRERAAANVSASMAGCSTVSVSIRP